MAAIFGSAALAAAMWLAIRFLAPQLTGMDDAASRLIFASGCCLLALLFTFVPMVQAVAHERLQSAAFDPLGGAKTRRLEVNGRVLTNTGEQFLIFAPGLLGLAFYSPGGGAMRAVLATAIVWTVQRWAFWIGYHRSAALRGLGVPGMALALVVLIYVGARIGADVAGEAGAITVVAGYLALEGILFRLTRSRSR